MSEKSGLRGILPQDYRPRNGRVWNCWAFILMRICSEKWHKRVQNPPLLWRKGRCIQTILSFWCYPAVQPPAPRTVCEGSRAGGSFRTFVFLPLNKDLFSEAGGGRGLSLFGSRTGHEIELCSFYSNTTAALLSRCSKKLLRLNQRNKTF